jgi:hypothetical protein
LITPALAALLLAVSGLAPGAGNPPVTLQTAALIDAAFDSDLALAAVAELDGLIRWPGNADFDAAIAQVVEGLEASGYVKEQDATAQDRLTYRVEDYPLERPAWRPVDAALRIDGDDEPLMSFGTNRNLLALNSYSTPGGEMLLDVIDVGNAEGDALERFDLRGKAVLGDRDVEALFEEAVIARGAAGVLSYSMPAYTQPEVARDVVQFGSIPYDDSARSWGISLSYAAQERLRLALAAGPVRVRVGTRVEWTPGAIEKTVVAEIRGKTHPGERLVFSAHIQEPGANDNASGVAAQLEMARVVAQLSASGATDPKRTITFLWGNETVSTQRFVTQDTGRARGILWGLSMDMVGQDPVKTGASFLIEKMPDPSAIWTRGDDSFSEWGAEPISLDQMMPHYLNDVVLARALERSAKNGWQVGMNPFEGGSDHVPFLDAGIPALLLWHFTDRYYHTDLDRLDKVSAAEMKNVGVTALTTALTVASADAATATQLVAELRDAAIARLRTETALSVAAIHDRGSMETEKEILQAWADWYDDALLSSADIEVGGSSAAVRDHIAAAREAVRKLHDDSLERLAAADPGTPQGE